MNLGETIHQLRLHNNLSQEALADALGVSRQSVSKWENGNAVPELDKLVKMSALFSISLDELVGNQTIPSPQPREVPPQTQNSAPLTTADMVGVLILLFGILIPILILTTSSLHDSTLLMVLGLFVIPPLAIFCAALCAPKNRVLFRVFLVYGIGFGILAAIAGNVLAPFIVILYFFALGFWNDRLS